MKLLVKRRVRVSMVAQSAQRRGLVRRYLLVCPMLSLAVSLQCMQQLQEESYVHGTTLLADPLVEVYTVQRN